MANTKNPFISNSLIGKRLRAIKGSRHAHKVIRESGRRCCQEAHAAMLANAAKRKAARELLAKQGVPPLIVYVDPSA